MTARDDLYAYATSAHLDDEMVGKLLDRHEQEVRNTVADDLRRFHEGEDASLVAELTRSIDVRLAVNGHRADHWRPAADAEGEPVAPLWVTARKSTAWLDKANGRGDHETAMRLMKLGEEVGEVMQAYIGMTGQNPRKGVTHTRADVAAELCDAIITAATALHLFTDDPAGTLDHHARRVGRRIDQIKEL